MKTGAAIGLMLVLVGAHCASAACSNDIDTFQMQTESKGKAAISKSSGGQATAAEREAEHGTGEAAQQSKVSLNDAKVAAGKGDEAGCQAALAKVRQKLGK